MSSKRLLLGTLLSGFILSIIFVQSFAYGPMTHDCCIKYTQKPVPLKAIKGFVEQSSLEVCRIDAIIFHTIAEKKICANGKEAWVKRALKKLSSRLKQLANTGSDGNDEEKKA
ncbi:C-C motif chemokine 20 [Amia ocellicauda]|uniref:C-C motif chemokine 20 n=1 Tax=Amia ocellicauda TaxID=2972642 RepID=UPI0034645B0E